MSAQAKELDGYVGFANLPNQVFRKSVQRGFEFTLMVVGQSGLGKSTLLNSLFLTDLYVEAAYPPATQRSPSTTSIESSTVNIAEGGVRLALTLVDTPGFGQGIDNSECWRPIVEHIDRQFEDYLNAESQIDRVQSADQRVHCCLYFICPTGHGLKSLDIECMKQLHNRVNIVPVIAKADTLTAEECAAFKKKVMEEITENDINVYGFPEDNGEDEEDVDTNRQMRERIPFAVVGSNTVLTVSGKKVRGRRYPWGVAEVENLEHCDFTALRNMLIRTHMQDLKDMTHTVHYESYRFKKLSNVVSPAMQLQGGSAGRNPLAQFEEEKKEHEKKMQKMQEEMEQVFEMKVMEKKQKLKDSQADLVRRHDQMKSGLEKQQRELDDRRRQFEEDKQEFEVLQRKYQQEQEALSMQRGQAGNHKGKDKHAGKDKKKHGHHHGKF